MHPILNFFLFSSMLEFTYWTPGLLQRHFLSINDCQNWCSYGKLSKILRLKQIPSTTSSCSFEDSDGGGGDDDVIIKQTFSMVSAEQVKWPLGENVCVDWSFSQSILQLYLKQSSVHREGEVCCSLEKKGVKGWPWPILEVQRCGCPILICLPVQPACLSLLNRWLYCTW